MLGSVAAHAQTGTGEILDTGTDSINTRYRATTDVDLTEYLVAGVQAADVSFSLPSSSCGGDVSDFYSSVTLSGSTLSLVSNTLGHVHGEHTRESTDCTVTAAVGAESESLTLSFRIARPRSMGNIQPTVTVEGQYSDALEVKVSSPGGHLSTFGGKWVALGWRVTGSHDWTRRIVSGANTEAKSPSSPSVLRIEGLEQGTSYTVQARVLSRQAFDNYADGRMIADGVLTELPSGLNSKWIRQLQRGAQSRAAEVETTTTAPVLSIADTEVDEGGEGTSATLTFTVTLDRTAEDTLPAQVDWKTAAGTGSNPATVWTDYNGNTGTLTFAATETSKTVEVTVLGDDADEPDETLEVELFNPVGATIGDGTAVGTITDDDPPEMSISDASVDEGDAGGTPMEFTVSLTSAPETRATVNWATAVGGNADTATHDTDFVVSRGTLTFGPDETEKSFTVTVTGDNVDEPDETFTVGLSGVTGATIVDGSGTGTIRNDDDDPTVTLALTPPSVGENGGVSTVTATLNHPSSDATTVTVSAAAVSPAVEGDYTPSTNRTLTIAAGGTTSTGTVTITAVNNAVDAPDKQVTVSATAANGQGITAPQDVTLTITDDELPQMSISDASVDEGDAGDTPTLTFRVTLTSAPETQATVNWATAAGGGTDTATPDTDFVVGTGTLTFGPTETEKNITVTVTGDDVDEPDETFTVALSSASATGATVVDSGGIGTIRNDDDDPTVTLVLTPPSVGENGGVSRVTATLNHPSSDATTVTVSAAPVSPAVAGDYTLSTDRTLTIAAGDTASTGTVTITAVNNAVDAPDKEVTVSATAVNGQGITNPQDVTLTITDDEPPQMSLSDASVDEGDDGDTPTLTFTVSLTSAPETPVTVNWATSAGGGTDAATPDTDFVAGTGTLTFAATETEQTFTVTVTGDNVDEPDETFTVGLSNATGAAITDGSGTGTIRNDDDDPTITLVLTPPSIGENGGVSRVTATLNHPSSDATTVTVSAAAVSPAVAGDYTLSTNRTLTIAAGDTTSTGTVTVTAVNNAVDAPDKEVTVSATASNGQGITAPQDVTLTITDDEGPPVVTLVLTPPSVAENGGVSTVTATLNRASSADTTVTVSAAPVSPAVAGDFALGTNRTLTIAAGGTTSTGVVTITAQDNAVDTPNKQVTVSGTASNGQGITDPQDVTLTITDDEGPPTVTLVLTPSSIGEDGGVSTVTATLNRTSSADTTVTVSAAPVSPAVAGDYTLSTNRTLTIAAGGTTSTGAVTITAVDNAVDARDKEVTVSGSAVNGQGITAPQDVTLTITDDDMPELSIANASVSEGGAGTTAALTFTVTLTPAATLPVSVDWATSDGSATAGADYTAGSGSLTFNDGDSTGTITVTVTGDNIDEADETLTVTLSGASGATIGDGTGTGTITNDEADPTVTLILTPPSIGENGGVSTVMARLSHPSNAATTVTVSAAPVGPTVAGDYTLSTNRELTIAAGNTGSTGAEVTITAVDNAEDSADKEVTVSGTAVNGQGITAPQDVTLTITDDDTPRLSIADASAAEGDAGTTATLTFTVTLDPPATQPATVDWTTSDNTATAGTDYRRGSGTLSFAVGDSSKTVTVTVTGDNVDEVNETLTVTLSNVAGAEIQKATATGTITDDDAPAFSVGDASVTESNTGTTRTLTFTVTLTPAATLPVSVDWATADGTAAAGTDYTAANGSLAFSRGERSKTVSVTVTGDNVDEPNETVSVVLSNVAGATIDDGTGTGTIRDNDATPTVTLVLTPPSIGEAGGVSTVTATQNGLSSDATTVTVSATPVSPAVAGDFALSSNAVLTIAAGATASTGVVTITAQDNAEDALNKRVTVSGTAANEHAITPPRNVTLTITDDDAPSFTIADTSVTEGNAGQRATLTFTVTLTPAATLPVSVDWATSGGTATPGTDYTARRGSLRFSRGEGSRTVTVSVRGDDVDEPNETVTVVLSNPAGATIGDGTGTGTITDDDGPPVVTLTLAPSSIGENGGVSTVTATQDGVSSAPTTVTVSAAPVGPAVPGDYALSSNAVLTIAAGARRSTGVVTITAVNNAVDALDKQVTVSGAAANLQGITGPQDVTLAITDDDEPALSIGDASAAEGDAGTTATLTFTVRLTPAATLPVTVDWATADGTAMAGADYTAAGGSLAFGSGEDSKTVTVTVLGDDLDEPDETLTVRLSNAPGAALEDATATGTITDDDLPAVTVAARTETVKEGRAAVFIVTRATTDTAAPLPVAFTLADPGTVLAPDAPTAATIPARATRVQVRIATVNDNIEEPDTTLTLTLGSSADYVVGQPDAATVTISDAGILSALAEGRRAGAGALLRRHSERFAQLTSDVALARLAGAHRESAGDFSLGNDGVRAGGDLAADLSPGWDGWARIRYADLDGSAEGSVRTVYAGADTRSVDGRSAWGVLVGYEPGRVTAEDVRLEVRHLQLGLYGAHRLSRALTVDGALGWGRGSGDVSLVGGARPVTASHRSQRIVARAGLTGDLGWGGGGLRVAPQLDLLLAREDLDGFTDSLGHDAPAERLWRARLGFGPRVTWELDGSTTHGTLRLGLDAHNLESEDRTRELAVSLELGHRWDIDESSVLELSAGFDGLWTDWFTSVSLGLNYALEF